MNESLSEVEFAALVQTLSEPEKEQTPVTSQTFTKLHMKTVSFLIKRSQLFIMSPTKLTDDLLELGFDEAKAKVFVSQWTKSLKPVMQRLEADDNADEATINELERVSWKLDVELVSSNRKQRTKKPMGEIGLEMNTGSECLLLDHRGLSQLFDALEDIQAEMGALKGSG